jgi:hypothetical protein
MSNLVPPPPSIPPPVAPAEFLALQAIVMVLLQSHIVTSGFREPGVYLGQLSTLCRDAIEAADSTRHNDSEKREAIGHVSRILDGIHFPPPMELAN